MTGTPDAASCVISSPCPERWDGQGEVGVLTVAWDSASSAGPVELSLPTGSGRWLGPGPQQVVSDTSLMLQGGGMRGVGQA